MPRSSHYNTLILNSLRRRHRAEKRFRFYGWGALVCIVTIVSILLGGILKEGLAAFSKYGVLLDLPRNPGRNATLAKDAQGLLVEAVFNDAQLSLTAKERHSVMSLLSPLAVRQFRQAYDAPLKQRNVWLPLSDKANLILKTMADQGAEPNISALNDIQLQWLQTMQAEQRTRLRVNWNFFTQADSREPEQAGIWGAIVGSFYTVIITALLALPLGVGAAIYLEEFAADTWVSRFIDLNIRNLTAVPSVIFGLLGVGIFLNVFHLPRSSSLVAGATLALIALPIIILTTRIALRAVPHSIRQAAQGLGAAPLQVVFHHILPLAMSGVMTGTILGLARTLSESAPLLLLGMVAFVADAPVSPLDPATALPVQIYTWARNPEAGFTENAAAAIIVLLSFLIILNLSAVVIRKRFERRW